MRRLQVVGLGLAALLVSALPLVAAETTVKGEVVDAQCFLKDKGKRGADHQACANGCVKKGGPVAIVTESGEVYTITGSYAENKNAKLVDFVAKTVEAKGDVTEKDGQKLIAVTSLVAAQ